jgi:hypothetical protein
MTHARERFITSIDALRIWESNGNSQSGKEQDDTAVDKAHFGELQKDT